MQHLRQQVLHLRQLAVRRQRRLVALAARLREARHENTALRHENAMLELEIERLRIETYTDPLTGLYNRTGMRHVWNEVAMEVTAVMIIDSDRFKLINDRYGHQTGDIVICYLGETIRSCGIIACRTGGDEFIGLVTDPEPEETAEQLRATVALPREINGHQITTTITIGLCLVEQAGNGLPTEALITYLERADIALYRGKRNGRNIITTIT